MKDPEGLVCPFTNPIAFPMVLKDDGEVRESPQSHR